jgi:hypothetical protein
MAILNITAEQLKQACAGVYGPLYEHAPAQMYYDHFYGHPHTTFIWASFPEKFTHAAACKLDQLRTKLKTQYGLEADVVFCCYYQLMDTDDMVRHAVRISEM